MLKRIKRILKRILKNALLFPVLIVFAKGTYEEGPEPELLTTEYTEPAMTALEDLAYGEAPTLPTVNLPGVTGEESKLLSQGMSLIKQLMSGEMPEAYKMGMEKIKSVLGGEYNPLTSPYYKGLKEEAARTEEKGISDIRQRSQLGGMLYSEPAMGAEAEFKGILGTGLTKELGRLYEADIGRQTGMIPQLLGYSGQKAAMPGQALSGIGALAPLAGKGGDIARKQALANWGVETEQALFPYKYKAPILESLADWGNWYTPQQYYKPGPLDYILGGIGAIL
ncbi:MAG: hypothetical protein U9O59_07250 [Actinomycetota bacterium]|nr:hypothetical protein [Actinomycetota bacterium]